MASFKVDTAKNTWRDFGIGESGDIIDIAQKIRNCSVEMALRNFAGMCAYIHSVSNAKTPTNISFFQSKEYLQENTITRIIDICPITNPKLVEYVQSRKISLDLANCYCREIHYQNQSGQFFSVGFGNDKGGYELSRSNGFKGCIPPKEITTFQNNSKAPELVIEIAEHLAKTKKLYHKFFSQ